MRKRNYVKSGRTSRTTGSKGPMIVAVVLISLICVYFLVSFVLGEMGLVKYYRMHAQFSSLSEDIAKLRQDNVRLMRDVHSLKTDPAYIERIARDKLGLARPGEIVYYYGEPASP